MLNESELYLVQRVWWDVVQMSLRLLDYQIYGHLLKVVDVQHEHHQSYRLQQWHP